MLGEFVVFRRGLAALVELRLAGAALTLYFLEGILALILLISLVSFVASGLWVFYRARDTRLLLAAPMPAHALYALRSVETFALTSWALAVVGVPALAALGVAYRQPAGFYLVGGLTLAAFGVLLGGAGALFTTIAGAAFRRAPTRLAAGIVVAILVAAFAVLIGRNLVPSTGDFYTIFEPGLMNGKPASIKFIEAKFALWPSHPFAAALYAGATGGPAGSGVTRGLVWLLPLAAVLAAATAGRALYAVTLPVIAETFALPARGRRGRRRPRPFPRYLHGPIGTLLERDLVAIARSPLEWSRAVFIGFLLVLYTSFIFVAPLRDVADRPEAVARLILLNMLAAGYFLTAVGLRFVFPGLSLEGRAAWVLFSSPVRIERLLGGKLLLSVALLGVTVVPIAVAGTLRLVRDPALIAIMVALLLLVAATTATLLLAFGAAWPNFREGNPEALSTSGSGLAATLVCLVYVAIVGGIARNAARAAFAGGSVLAPLALAAALSAVLVAGALALVAARVRGLEAP